MSFQPGDIVIKGSWPCKLVNMERGRNPVSWRVEYFTWKAKGRTSIVPQGAIFALHRDYRFKKSTEQHTKAIKEAKETLGGKLWGSQCGRAPSYKKLEFNGVENTPDQIQKIVSRDLKLELDDSEDIRKSGTNGNHHRGEPKEELEKEEQEKEERMKEDEEKNGDGEYEDDEDQKMADEKNRNYKAPMNRKRFLTEDKDDALFSPPPPKQKTTPNSTIWGTFVTKISGFLGGK